MLCALAFAAAWLIVSGLCLHWQCVELAAAGKQIWLGLYNETDNRISLSAKSHFPQTSDHHRTSTEFFAQALRDGRLENFTTADFGGPELPLPSGTNPSALTTPNVAWCVTLNCNDNSWDRKADTPPDTPFLFTRNFCAAPASAPGQPPTYGDSLDDITGLCPFTQPFGNRAAVIVTFGGSSKILTARDIARARKNGTFQKLFNPSGLSLPFLHP